MEVRIGEWLSEGWGLIKDDLMTFALAALIVALLGALSLGVCAYPLMFGLYIMIFRRMRGESVASGEVMQGFSRFGNGLYLFGLMIAFSCVLGIVFAVPMGLLGALHGQHAQQPNPGLQLGVQGISQIISVLLQTVLFFAYARIADINCDPITAIKDSFAVVQRNFLPFLACAFLFGLVQGLGALACCVGIFVTMPLAIAATACAYRDVFGVSSFGIPPRGVSYQAPKAGMAMPPTAGPSVPPPPGPPLPPVAPPSATPPPPLVTPPPPPIAPPPPVAPPPMASPPPEAPPFPEPPSESEDTPAS